VYRRLKIEVVKNKCDVKEVRRDEERGRLGVI